MAGRSDFKRRLRQFQTEVDQRVKQFFASPNEILDAAAGLYSQKAVETIREFSIRPSKRVRGALVLAAYEACGGENRSAALDAAVVVELQHNYLLIIDDVMDQSVTRRGGDTVHVQYAKELGKKTVSFHAAEMIAINIGLLIQHIASELACRLTSDSATLLELNARMHKNLALTGFGQIEDLTHGLRDDVSEQDILRMYMYKSGFYTFVNPLQVGVVLAGRHSDQLDASIQEFGTNAGIVYQLQDDIIGLFGNAKETGKPVLDDLREGKLTFLMHHALTSAQQADRRRLESILGNESATEQDRQAVLKIMESTGSRQNCERKIDEALTAARSALGGGAWPVQLSVFLEQLLAHLEGRRV